MTNTEDYDKLVIVTTGLPKGEKNMFIYESHLSGLFTSDYPIDYEDLYCESCGDQDWEIGEFNSAIDFLEYFADEINVEGTGGYDLEYVLSILDFDDCPNYITALQIVEKEKIESLISHNIFFVYKSENRDFLTYIANYEWFEDEGCYIIYLNVPQEAQQFIVSFKELYTLERKYANE